MHNMKYENVFCLCVNSEYFLSWSYTHIHKRRFVLLAYHGRDRMVVGFTTTCAIRAYHH
jgi:hypothetical protein